MTPPKTPPERNAMMVLVVCSMISYAVYYFSSFSGSAKTKKPIPVRIEIIPTEKRYLYGRVVSPVSIYISPTLYQNPELLYPSAKTKEMRGMQIPTRIRIIPIFLYLDIWKASNGCDYIYHMQNILLYELPFFAELYHDSFHTVNKKIFKINRT